MLVKSRGIVLNKVKFGDHKLIVKIYTESSGIKSFIVSQSRSKSSAVKTNLLMPLQPVELVINPGKTEHALSHIKELSASVHLNEAHTQLIKSSILLFINEVLVKCVKEEEANPSLFEFLYHSIVMLDLMDKGYENFHLYFLAELTKYLGFYPQPYEDEAYKIFDLREGCFVEEKHITAFCLNEPTSLLFAGLLAVRSGSLAEYKLNYTDRKALLAALINYYELHINNFTAPKSLEVLETVLN